MIEPEHPKLSVVRQCDLVSISRSGFYYQPNGETPLNLTLMRPIDVGAVAKAESDLKVLINRNLDAVGRTEHTALTAFTDGCSGLRRILADAGSPRRRFSIGPLE
jgi:hypothetical protein